MNRRALLLLASLALAGCGATVPNAAPSPAELTADFAGSPAPLAALHSRGNQLVAGTSPGRFAALLASLHGYPVIVNKWASWCYPCTTEFPVFQQVSAQYGRTVAFLGLNAGDQSGAARAFLAHHPVSYPSYEDPHEAIAQSVDLASFYPMTIFYDTHGNVAFIHQGPYTSVAALSTDIHRYLHA
jgi:thiol-disulfide isomerase/thioredoxin